MLHCLATKRVTLSLLGMSLSRVKIHGLCGVDRLLGLYHSWICTWLL